MADKDQRLVTFYNDNEGWNFTSPIKPLLANAVISAMLTGEFKEATTKRIQVPDSSRSVVEQFVQDLASGAKSIFVASNTAFADRIQLARIAHRFDAQQLVNAYLRTLLNFAARDRSGNIAAQYYDACKVVFELSAKEFYPPAVRLISQKPDLLFENDDGILLKSLCDENAKKESANNLQGFTLEMSPWVHPVIDNKAHRCLKVLLDYLPLTVHDLHLCAADSTLPEDLILKLLETDPRLGDKFITHHNTTGVGVLLRQFPDEYDFWGRAFKQGFMEIIKFSPKAMLTRNDGEYVFGETAIYHGWINCVEYLLEQGWKPTTKALTMAMSGYQNSKLVKMLVQHVKPDSRTIDASSIQKKCIAYDPERWACIDLIEKAALENALESDLYKIYSKSP